MEGRRGVMRIAYLSSSIIQSKAANVVHVVRMCEAFAKAGHKVTLFAYRTEDALPDLKQRYGIEYPFEIILIPINKMSYWSKKTATFRLIRKFDADSYDLIYSRNIALSTLAIGKKKILVHESHAFPLTFRRFILEKRLLLKKNLAALVVITQALLFKYQKEFSCDTGKMLIAADAATVPPSPETTAVTCNTIGYIGHLYDGRGIDIIIELAKSFPVLKFVIIGGEEEHVERWKKNCSDVVNLSFTGFVPHADLGQYYQDIDVMLAPYQTTIRIEGNVGDTSQWMSPLKIFEYMAHRKPILASDLPVLREVLRDDENCLLCTTDNLESWKAQLQRLVEDKELRHRLSRQAYNDFIENYTWDARVKKIMEFIKGRIS